MYITFAGTNSGPCRGFYRKQSLADAAATDNAEIVAHVGALEVGSQVPSEAYFNGTAVVSDDAYETITLEDLSSLQKKKNAFRAHHTYLTNQSHAIIEEGLAHAIAEQHIIHNMIAFAHHGAYTVAHDADLSDDQKIAWAVNQQLGPSDIAGASLEVRAFHWYEAVRALSSPTAPTSACTWVNPSTGARLPVSSIYGQITTIFGDDPIVVTESDLAQGGWIEGLT